MRFISPWTALFAGLAAIGALLLLYLLKLRRQRVEIPSTLLWQRSFEDLQVNAPFQRLRWSWLFLIQLLIILAIAAAIAQPLLQGPARPLDRLILLIDVSASMNSLVEPASTDDPAVTRLDIARRRAIEIIDRADATEASGVDAGGEIMIIAVGATPAVISGYETNRAVLRSAVAALSATDEAADLQAALQAAGAFARRAGATSESAESDRAAVVLISDGGVAPPVDPDGFRLAAGEFSLIVIPGDMSTDGAPVNRGIVALSARRDIDDPTMARVFVRLAHTDDSPGEVTVTLRVNDIAQGAKTLTLPAAGDTAPGEAATTFTVSAPDAALIEVATGGTDALAADDRAAIILPAPARPRIAVVHPGTPDAFLMSILEAIDPDTLRRYPAGLADDIDPGAFDLVIFDRIAPVELPPIPTLTVGAVPPGIARCADAPEGGARILSWDRQHPLLRYVSLDNLIYTGTSALELPATATPLAFGPDGPVMATWRARGVAHTVVAFALRESTWPAHVSFAVFLQNVIDRSVRRDGVGTQAVVRPGDVVTVRAETSAIEIYRRGEVAPLRRIEVDTDAGDVATIPPLRRVGVYTLDGAVDADRQLAVSLLDDTETDIRPRPALQVNAAPAAATGVAELAPRALWPWFAAAALVLAVVEWLLYSAKVWIR